MALCCLICDIDAEQSHVDTIKGWLTENEHEAVYSDISDAEHGNYIRIGRDYVIAKVGGMKQLFNDAPETEIGNGVSIRLRFGNEGRYIEQCLDFLNDNL